MQVGKKKVSVKRTISVNYKAGFVNLKASMSNQSLPRHEYIGQIHALFSTSGKEKLWRATDSFLTVARLLTFQGHSNSKRPKDRVQRQIGCCLLPAVLWIWLVRFRSLSEEKDQRTAPVFTLSSWSWKRTERPTCHGQWSSEVSVLLVAYPWNTLTMQC